MAEHAARGVVAGIVTRHARRLLFGLLVAALGAAAPAVAADPKGDAVPAGATGPSGNRAAAVDGTGGPKGDAAAAAHAGDSTLRFVRDGGVVTELDRPALERACGLQTVQIDDPYYRTRKSFRACPLRRVLQLGFGDDALAHPDDDIFLRARDGYVKTTTAKRLAEDGGYLALADADHAHDGDPGWQPIDRRQVDPAPYYMVWAKPEQRDGHGYPWPYQLVAIEITSFAREYPHTVPSKAKRDTPPWRGFAIFRDECVSCHAVNGEGGKVGPDLNVPRSIVEYRPAAQIKAYIRDPESFRHTSMPAHPHLKPADLDALIAYFQVMKTMKHDPGRTE